MSTTPERESLAQPWRGIHKRLIVLGAGLIAQRHWGEPINTKEAAEQDDALAALALEARSIADALAHEAAMSAPVPQVLPLDFKPHFPDCETAEPSLASLIHRYYGFYFDNPRSTEYAEAYIAALQGAKP